MITNINALRHKIVCEKCNTCFKSMKLLTDHLKRRKNPCNLKFVDKFEKESMMFTVKPNIMKRLALKYPKYFKDIDLNYPYQIYFDFEAINLRTKRKKGQATIFYKDHHPLSVSFMSNYDKKIIKHYMLKMKMKLMA